MKEKTFFRITTKNRNGLSALVREILTENKIRFKDNVNGNGAAYVSFYCNPQEGKTEFWDWYDRPSSGNYTELSYIDFLEEIESLPSDEKAFVKFPALLNGAFEVEINPDAVKIGCQTFGHNEWEKIKEKVMEWRKPVEVMANKDYRLNISEKGILIGGYGEFISFEVFDKLSAAIEDFKK